MNHIKVSNSSNVDTIGYDEQTQTLEVRYLANGVAAGLGPLYSYSPVPVVLHMQLMAAHSKGQYLSKHVKKNLAFKCTLVDEAKQHKKYEIDPYFGPSGNVPLEPYLGTKQTKPRPPKNVGHGVVDDDKLKQL